MQLSWLLPFLEMLRLYAQTSKEIDLAMLNAEQYFLREGRLVSTDLDWLPNSAKIGTGFDTVVGSPICFSEVCQMEGFRRPVFNLSFTKQPIGSCTNAFIPNNVFLDCLSSRQLVAETQSISTLEELSKSIHRGIEFSASAGMLDLSLRYRYSKEIRSMVDTILQANSTVYFTRGIISWARISAFAPSLEISDSFRYVIRHMPCCGDSAQLEEYVTHYIIGYYGLAFVDDLLLGGIIQQKIVVSQENKRNLQESGINITHDTGIKFASSIFSASFGIKPSVEIDNTQLNTFRKFSQQSSLMTVGGTTDLGTIEEWSKTVAGNPTILKFRIASLLDLLTTQRFPDDSMIDQKRELIRKALVKYIDAPVFCYKNCSGNGICSRGDYFGVGICQCKTGWSGLYCSNFNRVPTGILTRFVEGNACPVGFQYNRHRLGLRSYFPPNFVIGTINLNNLLDEPKIFQTCSTTDENHAFAPIRTLCGFVYFSLTILCGKHNPYTGSCPPGYSPYTWTSPGSYLVTAWSCTKNSNASYDAPGTLCGLHSTIDYGGNEQTACDNLDLSKGKCPNGFTFYQTWLPEVITGAWLRICASS